MRNLKKYLVLRKAILWIGHPALLLSCIPALLAISDPLANAELAAWLFLAPALICLFHVVEIATGARWVVQEHQIRDLVEKGV